jgi:exodeoxyribonuclease-3
MRIASWNINSVRLRIAQVARIVAEIKPDVLCLQETKCRDGDFPAGAFYEMGLKHLHVVGQKGHHGVAIASRLPLEPVETPPLCPMGEARVAAARIGGVDIHNLYVPAGGDEPDTATNGKFAHKLAFLARMQAHYRMRPSNLILLGDLNIAPGEHDVWSHKQLLNVVSHTPEETQCLDAVLKDGGFVDLVRAHKPEPEKVFTWWSYRNQDWRVSNRGRRLDHIWSSKDIAPALKDVVIYPHTRDWPRPSDHAPVLARLG